MRLGIAFLLLAAVGLKTHQLATEPLLAAGLLESRGFLLAVVQFEILLAFWLISGLMLARNRGKGAAIRTGLELARGRFTIIQDADLEYDPEDYPRVIAPLLAGDAAVVYGSRVLRPGANGPKLERVPGGRVVVEPVRVGALRPAVDG